jgi:hypothetical protein
MIYSHLKYYFMVLLIKGAEALWAWPSRRFIGLKGDFFSWAQGLFGRGKISRIISTCYQDKFWA